MSNSTQFTEHQTYILSVVNVTSGALSAVGASFIIICYMLMTPSRRAGVRLILILACSNLGAAMGHLMFDQNDDTTCKVQAFVIGLFEPASFYWNFAIALSMFLVVVRGKSADDLARYEKIYHIIFWPIAVAMAIVPWPLNYYHRAGAWCWIAPDGPAVYLLRTFQFYMPLWAVLLANTFLYVFIVRQLRRSAEQLGGSTGASSRYAYSRRFFLYPLCLFIAWVFPTVNRFQNWADPDYPLFWLFFLHSFFAALMGFLNAIAYSFDPVVRDLLRPYLCKKKSTLFLDEDITALSGGDNGESRTQYVDIATAEKMVRQSRSMDKSVSVPLTTL